MKTRIRRLIRFISLLALVVWPVQALAQQSTAPPRHEGIGIGIKGGVVMSSLSEKDFPDEFADRTGVIGGLFLGGNRPGVMGVGVDILYARKGAKDPDSSDTLDLDYLEVPVYLRFNAGSSSLNRASVYGIAGVDLNFLLKSRLSTDNKSLNDQFQRADYGIALGLGVEITRVILEGRYTKGFGNLAKDKDDPVVRGQTFAVMVGFRFN